MRTRRFGITLLPQDATEPEHLLKNADRAMYAAKKAGRNTLRFFDPAMQETLELRSQLEAGMRKAIQNDEFRLKKIVSCAEKFDSLLFTVTRYACLDETELRVHLTLQASFEVS